MSSAKGLEEFVKLTQVHRLASLHLEQFQPLIRRGLQNEMLVSFAAVCAKAGSYT
jgi:hypothetical protein